MDKFVVREPKKDPHLAVNKSAKDRAAQYPGVFHADNGLLFCSTCNIVLDHSRKSVLDKHLESVTHKKKVSNSDGKQQTLKTAFQCKTKPQAEKVKVCEEWIRACTSANVPLHKSDSPIMRQFLDTRVVNGGAIPKASQLRDYYLFDVYQVEKSELKKKIEGKPVALMVDELSDDEGRYVLDIMVVILDFDELSPSGNTVAYLLDTHFLSATNNKTVSQAVVKTVNDFNIEFDNVRVFNSDNVGYMKKAFNDTLSCLFPLCVHITCNSHVVNLVASDFKKGFKEVNEFVKCFRNLFFIPSGRKSRFLAFLRNALGREEGVKMPPNPNTKSWGAWFESVLYHAEHYLLFNNFIKEELDRGRNVACNSLLRLEEMYSDEIFMKKLGAQLEFLKEKSPTLKIYIDFFQQKVPHITEVHNKMESLMYYLEQNTHLSEDDLAFCFQSNIFSCEEREELVLLANSAFTSAHEKLRKYVVAGAQPALEFLRQVRLLDPRNLVFADRTIDANDSIPEFDAVSRNEWDLYVNHLGPEAIKGSTDGNLDLVLFWKSCASDLPEFYKIASCYCTATAGSYDVERAFSAYDDIPDDKRRSLNQSTIKAFHFLNWNLRVQFSDEKKKDQPSATVPLLNKRMPQSTVKQTAEKQEPNSTPKSHVPKKEMKQSQYTEDMGKPKTRVPKEEMKQAHHTESMGKPKTHVPKEEMKQAQHTESMGKPNDQKRGTKRKMSDSAVKTKKPKEMSGKSTIASISRFCFSGRSASTSSTLSATCTVDYGLSHDIVTVFAREDTCVFPLYKEPLVQFLLDDMTRFKGSNLTDKEDLQGLIGGNTTDKENYLNNFIIDEYLKLLAAEASAQGLKAETIGWEPFEKAAGLKPPSNILKGKAPLLEQDIVLVPLNPGQSEHWSLLVVKPKEREMFVLDSLAASFVKPSTKNAIVKMCNLLQEIDPKLKPEEWNFSTNTPQDIPQQSNCYDCGVFVCAYARCLLLKSSLPDDFTSFRKHMVLELHGGKIQGFDELPTPQEETYYAVEYQKSFYIGRVLQRSDDSHAMYKFLHKCSSQMFDWPKRDDIETCHDSCVFYGPVSVVGNAPFTSPQLMEIDQVFNWLRKSRKTKK